MKTPWILVLIIMFYQGVEQCNHLKFDKLVPATHRHQKPSRNVLALSRYAVNLNNTCFDKYKQCPELAKTNCHKYGNGCRKVRQQVIHYSQQSIPIFHSNRAVDFVMDWLPILLISAGIKAVTVVKWPQITASCQTLQKTAALAVD